MIHTLTKDKAVEASPGDEFVFNCTTSWTQYHIGVNTHDSSLVIGVWGPNNGTLGKARNKPGQKYVDRTLPKGTWRITVTGVSSPYEIRVTANSWWKKVFGW